VSIVRVCGGREATATSRFITLDEKQTREIVDLQLEKVFERLGEKKIILDVSNKAKDWLGKKGYDPNLGARPLRRVIQTELLDKLSMEIIEGNVMDGDEVQIDEKENSLVVKVATKKPA